MGQGPGRDPQRRVCWQMLMEGLFKEWNPLEGGADRHVPPLRHPYPGEIHLEVYGKGQGRGCKIRPGRQDTFLCAEGMPERNYLFRLHETGELPQIPLEEGRRKGREEVEEDILGTGL